MLGAAGGGSGTVALMAMSAVVLVSGLVTGKAAAVLIGAPGLGQLAVGQGVGLVVAMLASLSVQDGVVRFTLAASNPAERAARLAAAGRVSCWILLAGTVVVAAIVVVARAPLSQLLFRDDRGWMLVGSVAAGLLYAWASALLALATASGQVRLFALGSAAGAASTPVVSVIGFGWFGVHSVAAVMVVSQGGSVLAAAWAAVRLRPRSDRGDRRSGRLELRPQPGDRTVARAVLAFGVPQMLFQLTGLSLLVVMPLLVQDELGQGGTGLFRAAAALTAAVGVVMGSVISYGEFPRLAALSADGTALAAAANRTVRLVSAGTAALVVAVALTAPLLLVLLYSSEFRAAATLLWWLLAAEALRLVSLVLTAAVGAVRGSGVRLAAGAVSLAVSGGVAVVLVREHGLVGAGISGALGQACGLVVAAGLTWRLTALRPQWATSATFVATVAMVAGVLVLQATGGLLVAAPAALLAVAAVSAFVTPDIQRRLRMRPTAPLDATEPPDVADAPAAAGLALEVASR